MSDSNSNRPSEIDSGAVGSQPAPPNATAVQDTATPNMTMVQPMITPKPIARRSTKRNASEGTVEVMEYTEECALPKPHERFPVDPPEGVHPMLWGMLKTIRAEVSQISGLDDR